MPFTAGKSGLVDFDSNADRSPSVWLWDLAPDMEQYSKAIHIDTYSNSGQVIITIHTDQSGYLWISHVLH